MQNKWSNGEVAPGPEDFKAGREAYLSKDPSADVAEEFGKETTKPLQVTPIRARVVLRNHHALELQELIVKNDLEVTVRPKRAAIPVASPEELGAS